MTEPEPVPTDVEPTDFEALYRGAEDPWGYRTDWYERRKYDVTLACLPRDRYRLAWEPACSIGVLTSRLARRVDRVVASDVSPTAVAAARRAVAGPESGGTGGAGGPTPGSVEVAVSALPEPPAIRPGEADLVVLSEILYYLDDTDRRRTLDVAREVLAPGGDLLVVTWRDRSHDTYLSGEAVHAWLRTLPDWTPLVRHSDERFELDVLRRR